MCLESIQYTTRLPPDGTIGWKVVADMGDNGMRFLIYPITNIVPGVELTAVKNRALTAITNEVYTTGFHVISTMAQAERYRAECTWEKTVPVTMGGIRLAGLEGGMLVYVCDKITF